MTTFTELGLLPELLKAVAEQGYTEPTPIQAQAIPLILAGQDVMGGAQTGTGKTAGFTLPLLQRLAPHASTSVSPARHPVRALILAPTRELAQQVYESVCTYSKYLPLRSACIYGGVPMDPQIKQLRAGVEILVATPGRLLDHVQQKTLNLGQVEVVVLDEADRMLDMGFIPDVRRILSLLVSRKQGLLFSATFSEEIRKLADSFLKNPVLVEVARRNQTNESITHIVHPVAREKKRELLIHLIKSQEMKQVLVFCGTRLGTNRLAYQLNKEGVHTQAIHGDKNQSERTLALDEFKSGKVGVLVATDVAARGLDIDSLPFVVNFELPGTPEDYVHRIGRTGRAGALGTAISLVCSEEHEKLQDIEKLIKLSIRREIVPDFGPNVAEAPRMMERRHERRDDHRARPEVDRLTRREEKPRSAPKNVDPIFSAPYEPGASAAVTAAASAANRPTTSSKPQKQVAALLGGLVRKPG